MRFAAIFSSLWVVAWASVGGLAVAPVPPSDQDRLQGLWIYYVLLSATDQPPRPSDCPLIRISGNRVQHVEENAKGKGAAPKLSFTIDQTQNPRAVDLHWLEGDKKTTWKGIYALKGEEVRLAFSIKAGGKSWEVGTNRPASFNPGRPPKDSVLLVVVLQRAKARPVAARRELNWPLLLSIAYNGFGAVALGPGGKWVAASGAPGTAVRVWETASGKEVAALRGHDGEVMTVHFSRDGKRLFTATTSEVRTWELPGGKPLKRIPAGPGWEMNLTTSSDGKWLVSRPETEPRIAPDGKSVIASIRLWDTETGREVRRFEIVRTTAQLLGQCAAYFIWGKGSDTITGTALSRDGKWVVAGSERGEFHLWEAATGKKIRTFGRLSDVGGIPIGFSNDGKRLAASVYTLADLRKKDSPATVVLWDVAKGKATHAIRGNVFGWSLTGDGRWLITGREEKTVRIWDVGTGREVRAFTGHKGPVTGCSLSGDRKLLATYDQSGTARLWDVVTGKELRALEVRPRPDRVVFSPDAKVMAAWSTWRLTLWDLERGKKIRAMGR
jgi:uncharacterized protein (TIGR03067 family)